MLIGHIPAGYLTATAFLDRLQVARPLRRRLLGTALACSVAPDLDLLYFYTVGGDVHHHAYWPHWPLAWLALTASVLAVAAIRRSRTLALTAVFGGCAALLHLVLDSIAGSVRWAAPFSDHSTTLVEVPARYGWWVWSFVGHWTFGVELALLSLALLVAWRRQRRAAKAG